MGAKAGPRISQEGLIFYADPINRDSFPGEPTENLVPAGQRTCASTFTRQGYHLETWNYTLETNIDGRSDVNKVWHTNPGPDNAYADWGFHAYKSGGSQIGDVYTVSFDYKVLYGTDEPYLAIIYADGYKSPTSSSAATLGTPKRESLDYGWKRYKRTATITIAGNTWWRFGVYSDNAEYSCLVDNFQVELKDHATPFVDGSRTGNLINLSQPAYNGSFSGLVLYGEDGAVSFDGTDAYINIGNLGPYPTAWTDPFTLVTFFKIPSGVDWDAGTNRLGNLLGQGNYAGSIGLVRGTTDNQVGVWLRSDSGVYSNYTTVERDRWFMLAASWAPNNISLYLNDRLISSSTFSTYTGAPNQSNWLIAGRKAFSGSQGGNLTGDIGPTLIYNRALNSQEVSKIFNSYRGRFDI